MGTSHWADHTAGWGRIGPPLRPNDEVVAAMAALLREHRGPTLLLGVTPELATIGPDVTAVERNPSVIANVWPGDTATRRAVAGDWVDVKREGRRFTAAVGDGSINCVRYPDTAHRLLDAVARVLEPGGRLVCRAFVTPDPGEPIDTVRDRALAGQTPSFHAFKWELTMAIVAEDGAADIRVQRILDVFEDRFPDRGAAAAAAGWHLADMATIDIYRGSDEVYSFPTSAEIMRVVPDSFVNARFVAVGTSPLAERCPLLVADRSA
jgi:SAM-dependent methyltransferase